MYHVQKLCRHALWLEHGRARLYGDADHVAREYLAWHEAKTTAAARAVKAAPPRIGVRGDAGDARDRRRGRRGRRRRAAFGVDAEVRSPDDRPPVLAVGVVRADGTPVYGTTSEIDGAAPLRLGPARYAFSVRFTDLALLPGHYRLRAHAMDPEGLRLFDTHEVPFVVAGTTRELGYARLPHGWQAPAGADPAAGIADAAGAAPHEARACPRRPATSGRADDAMARLARELRCLFEFWLLPLVVALLPYRAGVALARGCARALPLYDAAARAGLAQYAAARPYGDTYAWLAEFRFAQLIDHADLFWTWTRSERFLLDRIDARPPTGLNPLVVVSMHYGQGLWLLRWLRAGGLPARFLSVRFDASAFESRLHYLYARLRMRTVERMSGVPPIYTGGAKEEIALTLEDARRRLRTDRRPGAARRRDGGQRTAVRPAGVLAARTRRLRARGRRRRHAARPRAACRMVGATSTRGGSPPPTSGASPRCSARAIDAAPGAWHVWHFLPAFAVPAALRSAATRVSRGALPPSGDTTSAVGNAPVGADAASPAATVPAGADAAPRAPSTVAAAASVPAERRARRHRGGGRAVIYQRRFDPDSGDSLARLARWLAPGATVLELGAAAGYFTEWMRGRGCTVDVIEIDPEAADAARPFARRVVVADLDAEGWEDALRDAAGEGDARTRATTSSSAPTCSSTCGMASGCWRACGRCWRRAASCCCRCPTSRTPR